MMAKYKSGSYHVIIFNDVGAKTKRKTGLSSSGDANAWGKKQIEKGKAHSYVTMRVIYNSVKPNGAWD
jgi:hypothetical protein